MAITEFPRAKGYRLGITQNEFTGVDQASTESARDSYFSSNPSKLAVYDGNSFLLIRLTYADSVTVQGRLAGSWFDYTPFLQGIPGEVASLVNVPVNEIPYKLIDGTFGGSGMRVLDTGSILAPPGFGVESGSVTFGDVLKLSEVAGFLGISNLLNSRQYTIVDYYTPRTAASSEPTVFHLIESEFEFISQPDASTNLSNNPLTFTYTVQNNARTNAIKFRTYAAMTNVRVKISQVSNGVTLKYIPNKTVWEKEVGGLSWSVGDNTFDFSDSPVILNAGTVLTFQIDADVVSLKGSATGSAYFTATLQRGVFDNVITDNVYSASDIKSKLESLSSPNKLGKTAIQDGVLSVNTQTGDVVISKTSLGLGNVDNTSDVNKPVSTAQATAISGSMTTHLAASDPHPQYTTTARSIAAAPVQSVNTKTGNVVLSTTDVLEGSNLYYQDSRVQNYLTTNGYNVKTVASSGSGSSVFNSNTSGAVSLRSIIGTGIASVTQNTNDITINVPIAPVQSVNGSTGTVVLTTTNIAEGSNLYYTDARVGSYLTTNGYTVKSISNLGSGSNVYIGDAAGSVTLRSIIASTPLVATQNASDITLTAPNVPRVYNSSGLVTSPKIWTGTATTTSGAWSIDYSSAGFTGVPSVQAIPMLTATNVYDRASASLSATPTTTTASGYGTRWANLALLGSTARTVPDGTVIYVTAIGS